MPVKFSSQIPPLHTHTLYKHLLYIIKVILISYFKANTDNQFSISYFETDLTYKKYWFKKWFFERYKNLKEKYDEFFIFYKNHQEAVFKVDDCEFQIKIV